MSRGCRVSAHQRLGRHLTGASLEGPMSPFPFRACPLFDTPLHVLVIKRARMVKVPWTREGQKPQTEKSAGSPVGLTLNDKAVDGHFFPNQWTSHSAECGTRPLRSQLFG